MTQKGARKQNVLLLHHLVLCARNVWKKKKKNKTKHSQIRVKTTMYETHNM